MAIDIFIVSKNHVFIDYENPPKKGFVKYIGVIAEGSSFFSQKAENKSNIMLLPFIVTYDNAVFNHKQIKQLKKEIKLLESDTEINQEALKLVSHAVDEALQSDDLYLKFEVD